MVPELDDPSVVEDNDEVGHADGGEPVRHQQGDRSGVGGDASRLGRVALKEGVFGGCVKRGSGLVQNEQEGVGAHHRAAETERLPLTAGEFGAVAELLAQLGVETVGQATG